jgi:uncharacterized protein involved in oxidation of intracellular sulfur
MKLLVILNDPPYGTERTYNGLRLVHNVLAKREGTEVTTFLMADATAAAKAGQQTPTGFYNLERLLKGILTRKGEVLLCGTCMDARGLREDELVEGCQRSTLDRLGVLTVEADQVLVF